jgi:PQQ-like domain
VVIGKAQRETRFAARAVRIDSTVVEADIRYPTDAGLAWQGAGAGPRGPKAGRQAARPDQPGRGPVPATGQDGAGVSRTLAWRTSQRREDVMKLNAKAGWTLARSIGEARALAAQARASARGRGAQTKLAAVVGSVLDVPCTDGLRQVRAGPGAQLSLGWRAPGAVSGSPVVGGHTVYSLDPAGGTLYALDADRGTVRASAPVGQTSRFASPTLAGGLVLVGTMTGVVALAAPAVAWEQTAGTPGPPADAWRQQTSTAATWTWSTSRTPQGYGHTAHKRSIPVRGGADDHLLKSHVHELREPGGHP